jgi:hypothetical protein
MPHATRPCNSTERRLIQGRDNYGSDTQEDGVQGRDEGESTGLTWNIPYDCSVILRQHDCLYFGTQTINEEFRLTTRCTLLPLAQNEAWVTRDAQLRGQ